QRSAPADDHALPPWQPEPGFRLNLSLLADFMRQPVRHFFQHRLQTRFDERRLVGQDEEVFSLGSLEYFQLARAMLEDRGPQETLDAAEQMLQQRAARLAREGVLPIGAWGSHWQQQLVSELVPVRKSWLAYCKRYPLASAKLPVS